ncbi:hypothetical protein AA101099_0233 [Neoasaia chiangmaiensis NBRC 101099]|nr:hypothetical protein AA101099_0233 [Neoasaia chiangmaiensis NBRC 101099]GEN15474.1 hypothetical protein NCH01_19050 [Neoasaia chiangmaiensis]
MAHKATAGYKYFVEEKIINTSKDLLWFGAGIWVLFIETNRVHSNDFFLSRNHNETQSDMKTRFRSVISLPNPRASSWGITLYEKNQVSSSCNLRRFPVSP